MKIDFWACFVFSVSMILEQPNEVLELELGNDVFGFSIEPLVDVGILV